LQDLVLWKFDADGILQWDRQYSPGIEAFRSGNVVIRSIDGGYLIAGGEFTTTFGFGARIVKLDASLNTAMDKSVGNGDITDITPLPGGGYAYVTETCIVDPYQFESFLCCIAEGECMYVGKIHENLTPAWEIKMDTAPIEMGAAILDGPENTHWIAGTYKTDESSKTGIHLVKIDSTGQIFQELFVGGPEDDVVTDLVKTDDGNMLLVGGTKSYGVGKRDIYLVKIDLSGNILWEKTIGTPGDEGAYAVVPALDGGFIIGGWTTSYQPNPYHRYGYIVKIDKDGNL
jgi:hypothetical protein